MKIKEQYNIFIKDTSISMSYQTFRKKIKLWYSLEEISKMNIQHWWRRNTKNKNFKEIFNEMKEKWYKYTYWTFMNNKHYLYKDNLNLLFIK